MWDSFRPLLALVMLVIIAVADARAADRGLVVAGLAGRAHFRIEAANRQLDRAIADSGGQADLAEIRESYEAALATSQDVARELRTAFALAVTATSINGDVVGLFNTAVDATVATIERLEELLARSASPPGGDALERYQRTLVRARALLADRRGGIKKLGPVNP